MKIASISHPLIINLMFLKYVPWVKCPYVLLPEQFSFIPADLAKLLKMSPFSLVVAMRIHLSDLQLQGIFYHVALASDKGREYGKPWENLGVRPDVEYITSAYILLAIIQLQNILGNVV